MDPFRKNLLPAFPERKPHRRVDVRGGETFEKTKCRDRKGKHMKRIILAASAAALLAGAMPAAAQDDPAGSAWQCRDQIEEQGLTPVSYRFRHGYRGHSRRSAYAYGGSRHRYYRERGDIRFQDRKLRESMGLPPR